MMRLSHWIIPVFFIASTTFSQEEVSPLNWLEGPNEATLSSISSLQIPAGYAFANGDDARTVLEAMGNIPSGGELGLITSTNDWFAVFEFDSIGYVKDDEKDTLDADALLETFRKGQIEANKALRERGLGELEIVGWFKEPYYNEKTQNLEWCMTLRSKGETEIFANHNIRILGRRGVTRITLVAGIDKLDEAIPSMAAVLDGYDYQSGGKYAEYRKGDAIAKYGLTALVAGGAAAVALKSGFLKPLIKFGAIAAAAVAAFFRKIFKRKE
jgi:uncharacterized membrane-anchored protein